MSGESGLEREVSNCKQLVYNTFLQFAKKESRKMELERNGTPTNFVLFCLCVCFRGNP